MRSSQSGQPGEPGEAAQGNIGGAGGAGGTGGYGMDTGGVGGAGGIGGTAAGNDLRTGLRYLATATVLLFLILMVLVVIGAREALISRERADAAASALCTFRQDLQGRYFAGKEFLQAHPQGVAGISAEDLQRSLNSQKATLDALSEHRSGLEC